MTVIGNVLTIEAFVTSKYLQLKRNTLIASLAVTDLLVGFTGISFAAMNFMAKGCGNYMIICDLFTAVPLHASFVHLCMMAVERYIAISCPLRYHVLVTQRRLVISILLSWAVSLAASMTYPLRYLNKQGPRKLHPTSANLHLSSINICLFLITAICIVVLNIKILCIARRQALAIATCTNSRHSDDRTNLSNVKQVKHLRSKGTRLILLIIITYLVTWTPYFLISLLFIYYPNNIMLLIFTTSAFFIGRLNSAINVLLYAYVSRDFKKAYKRLLCMKTSVTSVNTE